MTENKHTPGPWTIDRRTGREGCNHVIVARGGAVSGCIAFVNTDWPHPEQQAEQRANLQLMATAPDLLRALQGVLDAHSSYHSTGLRQQRWNEARTAIAKALGDSAHG